MQKIIKSNQIDGSFVFSKELIEDISLSILKRVPRAKSSVTLTLKDKTKLSLDEIKDIFKESNFGREEITELEVRYEYGRWSEKGYISIRISFGSYRGGCGYSVEVMASSVKDRDFVTTMSQEIEKRIFEGKSIFGTFLTKFWAEIIFFPFLGMGVVIYTLLKFKTLIPKDWSLIIAYSALIFGWILGTFLFKLLRKFFPMTIFYFSKKKDEYDRLVAIRRVVIGTVISSPLLAWFGNKLISIFLN